VTAVKTKRKVRIRIPPNRSPLFMIDGQVFIDLLFACGESVDVALDDLRQLLLKARPTNPVIGRKLTATELELFTKLRGSIDHETHANIIPNETARWRIRPRRPAR
jgi:hypothetical protein